MSKVPVGQSIAHAYSFLFGRFFQIVGTAWLPALIYATGYYFWLQNSATWLAPLTQDHQLLMNGIAATAGFAVLALFTRAVLGISLTQEALGIRNDLALAHFVIGPRELRLVFAQIRVILLILLLDIAVVAVVVLGLGAAAKYGAAIPPSPLIGGKSLVVVGAMVAAVLLYIAFVLTVLKLFFLLTAVAAVEHRASVRRGWQLAGGSGWRIVLVLLGTFLPLVAIVCGVVFYVAGADLSAALHAAGADPAARAHAMLQFYAGHAMLLSVVAGIAAVVGGALFAGATAAAYRTVTGHEAAEPEDDAALVAPLLVPVESHDDHGGGHEDHGHGGHDDHGHGSRDDDGHGDDGHGDNGHGDTGHGDHGQGGGHGHDDHGGGHDDHAHDGHDSHGHGGDDHGGGDDDGGHGGHEDHGHGDHGHGEKAHGHGDHGHDDHGHGDHGHGGHGDDHGHGSHGDHGHGNGGHGDGHHHHARAA